MKRFLYIFLIAFSFFKAHSQSERDKKFIVSIARAGLMEVKLAELSQTNGLAIEVTDIGKHLIDDHTKALNDLRVLADRKNISFPTTLNDKQQTAYAKMAKLKGSEFDMYYAKCTAQHHKKMKSEMKKEVKKGRDMDVAAWAQNNLPLVQHHQDITKAALTSLKKNK